MTNRIKIPRPLDTPQKGELTMKVYTGLGVLERCGDFLKQLNSENTLKTIFTGTQEQKGEAVFALIMELFAKKKLREFLNIITKDELGENDLEISELTEICKAFFLSIKENFNFALGFEMGRVMATME